FWRRLIDVRTLVVSTWVNHREKLGRPYPSTNAAAWARMERPARARIARWAPSTSTRRLCCPTSRLKAASSAWPCVYIPLRRTNSRWPHDEQQVESAQRRID